MKKILMIAPEPVFRVRGTPFSVRDRARCMGDLGHTVDLLTYPIGDDFESPGVSIHRTRSVPGITDIKIGFSWAKLPLDALLFVKAYRALSRGGYDIIHTHEEAGMMGAILAPYFRIPHIYDMHSSLPQQFENYGTSTARPVMAFMNWAERYILNRSQAIIAICPHLKDIALETVPAAPVTVIENLAQGPDHEPTRELIDAFLEEMDLTGRFVVGYTGTFEVNQGLEMLIDAFTACLDKMPDASLLLAGGETAQIESIRERCRKMGILDRCRIPGKIPFQRMPEVTAACNVLASPRRIGTNTPLKLYSYLKSGVPILATDLLTHTQVLDTDTAVLTPPDVKGLTEGLLRLYQDENLRIRLGKNAREKEKQYYSYEAYREKLNTLIESLFN